MNNQVRLRLACAGVGLGVLPAFNGLIFLLDHSSLRHGEWPLPLILFVLIVCPALPVAVLPALGGDQSPLWWALAALMNGALYAAIGPAFWRLSKNIKDSAFC